jgi:DNA-binding MarR family transcriptional regulator
VPARSAPDHSADQETTEVADCFFELIGNIVAQAEQLAHRLNIPAPFMKALLEKRGLARREPHPADRRVKNIVLTSEGEALKQQVEAEMTARMPWNRALNESERAQLLALIRKMLSADESGADAGASAKETLRGLFTNALQESITQSSAQDAKRTTSPAATGR